MPCELPDLETSCSWFSGREKRTTWGKSSFMW